MADDVTFQDANLSTPPDGTIVATDDVGAGRQVQWVKLAVPTGGSGTAWGDATDGLPVEITNATVAISGSISATSTVDLERSTVASSGLTTATTLYTAGDQMGAIMELTSVAATSGGYGTLTTLQLLSDTPLVIGPVRAWFFDRSVTLAADNAPWSVSDADMLFCQGTVVFGAPGNTALNALATLTSVNLDYVCNATSLFVALETLTTHTVHFAAADDLHVTAIAVRQ